MLAELSSLLPLVRATAEGRQSKDADTHYLDTSAFINDRTSLRSLSRLSPFTLQMLVIPYRPGAAHLAFPSSWTGPEQAGRGYHPA